MKFINSEKGFSFLEILITLTIMAALLPPLLTVFSNTTKTQFKFQDRQTAVYLLKMKMAEIEKNGYPEVGQNSKKFTENSDFEWKSVITDTGIEGLRKVSVTISWISRHKETRTLQMLTYMADRQMR